MGRAKIDSNLLRSRMVLHNVSSKALAKAEGWKSIATAHRKISGKTAFTAPEIQVCIELLSLDSETASKIFFTGGLS